MIDINMTGQNQRIVIAKACGWKTISSLTAKLDGVMLADKKFNGYLRKLVRWDATKTFRGWSKTEGIHTYEAGDELHSATTKEIEMQFDIPNVWKSPTGDIKRTIPDYLNNLNSIQEAVLSLPANLWEKYMLNLISVIDGGQRPKEHMFMVYNATSAHKAEAFLRTLNLWDDNK